MDFVQFRLLVTALQQPELVDDVRFSTNSARVANREALVDVISATLKRHGRDYWIERLTGLGFVSLSIGRRRDENDF